MTKTLERPLNLVRLGCLDCRRYHDAHIPCDDPTRLMRELDSWSYKHTGHRTNYDFLRREIPRDLDDSPFEAAGVAPWWLHFRENTNFQTSYVASANLTITSLNSLASDANLLAGASSASVDNGTSGAPLEIAISGLVKNNASSAPTVNTNINVWSYAAIDDTPTWPDTITGLDATKTITTTNILNTGLALLASMLVAATTSQINAFHSIALSPLFGGFLPRYWGIFVVHNSGQAIAATGNQITQKGLYVAG